MGADIVVAEGQSIGNALELRRPLCRPVRHAREIRAPDAGPPVRRDGRRRRPPRLRADALDPRAAHPPREGDEQHLHQLRASARWPSRSTCRCWARPGFARLAAAQPRQRRARSPTRSAQVPGVDGAQRHASSTSSPSALPRPRGRRSIEALAAKGVLAGVPVSRLEPDEPELADLLIVAATEINTDDDIATPTPRALTEVLLMHEPAGPPDAARRQPPPSAGDDLTGNAASLIEEPLIFEIGGTDATGVDLPSRAEVRAELGGLRAHRRHRPARPLRARGDAPLRAAVARRTTPSTPGSIRSARAR